MKCLLGLGLLVLLASCRKHPPPRPPETEWVGYSLDSGQYPKAEARLFKGPDAEARCEDFMSAERLRDWDRATSPSPSARFSSPGMAIPESQ